MIRRAKAPRVGAAILVCTLFGLLSCGPDFSPGSLGNDIDWSPDRPEMSRGDTVEPYRGDDLNVLEAQERYRTGLDVHAKVIWRTCTPNDGVCHNAKEYPDLHTPANFLAAINAPCNVQPGDYTSVFDRCEPVGDRFRLERNDFRRSIEIGWINHVEGEREEFNADNPPTTESPGLHIHLRDPIPMEGNSFNNAGLFSRQFTNDVGEQEELIFTRFQTRWWPIEGGKHLVGEIRANQNEQVENLMHVGIQQGDGNRNGIFGAEETETVTMIYPGRPEESYLIARVRGEMNDEKVPGSRMPLANQPLNISEMLALFCFVEGLPLQGTPDLAQPVDYANCSYSQDPENLNLLGEGVTWARRVSLIFQANCGGCHGGANPDAGLNFLASDAYEQLLQPSTQVPGLSLVEPGDPENSYLWLKLINDDSIEGLPMPYNPLTGEGRLTEAELGDIQTWITNGAIEDQ